MRLPSEHTTLRLVPSARDTNAAGDIFGGWLLSQADIAGSIVAPQRVPGHVVTVAVDGFHFIKPVLLGDIVSIFARITKLGSTSLTVAITIYIERKQGISVVTMKVAEGQFIYVHIDKQGKPLACQ